MMSRVCEVTGKKPMFGNNVSHAKNKTKRRFNINLQRKKFWLPDENRYVTLRVSTSGMKIIDKNSRMQSESSGRSTDIEIFIKQNCHMNTYMKKKI